ncbi:MAG TPA: Vms1/Ankzf1 family peptidyl-tRNA hydrolase [Candidatus Thermoplasmatota archaeon]|nr:Vms1/Ankzf1 family peptidyl-tRNA hydrolase [Candidatus Thermoplasmatota archaeon]
MPPTFDLRPLCERYDPESRPSYLTLYADLSEDRHLDSLERRRKELESAAPEGTDVAALWTAAEAAYQAEKAKDGTRGVAVFAGPDGWVEAHGLHEPIPTRLVLDSSPYVGPLAGYADDHEPFALVLLDSEQAAILSVLGGKGELKDEAGTSLIGRHRRGGMSQMRYQRHRQGQVNRFYDQVAERLDAVVKEEGLRRVAVAGPGTAKKEFVGRLPKALAEAVTTVEDVDFADSDDPVDDEVVRRFTRLMRDEEAKESARWVEALRRELSTGELATTGALESCRQAAAGRVERLVVLQGAAVPGSKCEEHQAVYARSEQCAHCGAEGADVDLVNEAVESTIRSSGWAEFVDSPEPFLEGVGGVGALLRW